MAVKYKYDEKRKEWATLVYDGRINSDGSKHRKRISSKKSSKDLENKVAAFKASLETAPKLTNITFYDYALSWLDLYKQNKELNTITMYKNTVKYFDVLDNVLLCDITRSHFQQVINLNQEHPRTCILISQTFKQIIKSAVYDGLITETIAARATMDISLPKYQRKEKKPLSEEEKEALLNCDLSDYKRAFVTILYYCGLRKSEALALTADDIDLKAKTVTINKALVNDGNKPMLKPYPKSDNGVRSVPLCKPAIDVLEPYLVNCKGLLFPNSYGAYMSPTSYRTMWNSIIASCNAYLGYNPNAKKNRIEKPIKNLTAHRLRHNFCSVLCYQVPRISTKTIAKILGDTEKMVLDVYSHILEEKEDIAGAINSAFKN